MGLFDKFKKPKEPRRIKGAAMLFCPEPDPRKALGQVEELFHIDHEDGRNNITLVQDDMEIILLAACPGDEGENGEYAKNQLEGVAGYVYHNQTGLVEIKRNLFYHLRQCKSLLQIVYSFDSASPAETQEKEEQVKAPLLEVTEKLQGVITFGDGMTLLDSQGRVILDKAGKSELEYYMPSEVPVPGSWAEDALPEYIERRDRSMALLREKRIYVTPWLPLLWEREEGPGRTLEEVCGRAAALLIVSLYSECRVGEHMSYEEGREFVAPIIEGYGGEFTYGEGPDPVCLAVREFVGDGVGPGAHRRSVLAHPHLRRAGVRPNHAGAPHHGGAGGGGQAAPTEGAAGPGRSDLPPPLGLRGRPGDEYARPPGAGGGRGHGAPPGPVLAGRLRRDVRLGRC